MNSFEEAGFDKLDDNELDEQLLDHELVNLMSNEKNKSP